MQLVDFILGETSIKFGEGYGRRSNRPGIFVPFVKFGGTLFNLFLVLLIKNSAGIVGLGSNLGCLNTRPRLLPNPLSNRLVDSFLTESVNLIKVVLNAVAFSYFGDGLGEKLGTVGEGGDFELSACIFTNLEVTLSEPVF